MKTPRLTIAFVALFAAFFLALNASDAADFDVDSWPDDGFPLVYAKDAPAFDAIWSALVSDPDASTPFGDALWFQLSRKDQRKAWRGKTLTVKGRLLRAVFVRTSAPDAEKVDGYYDVWILPPDSKRDPLRVIAKRAPVDFTTDDKLENETPYAPDVKYRDETFQATAVYYRATAYDAGDDFYAVPTLVALDFQTTSPTPKAAPRQDAKRARPIYKVAIVAALVLLWFLIRRALKKARTKSKNAGTTSILLFAALLSATPNACADDENADSFWALAAGLSEEDWARETGGVRPSLVAETPDADVANRRAAALTALSKLSGLLSISVLKERGDDAFRQTTLGEYFLRPDRENFANGPRVGYFAGASDSVDPIELNESEKERTGFQRLYRVELGDGPAKTIVYTPDAPDFLKFDRFTSFFDRAPTEGEYGGYGLAFGAELDAAKTETPVVLSPKLGFRLDAAPLSRHAGLDLGAYRSFRVYPVNALETEKDATKRKTIARSLRWTTDDREPFYETLAAVKRLNFKDDSREPLVDVVPLFNRPETLQGAKAKISGWARRVNMILVDDPDVKAATGIDRYYQLYVYTDDSQGWPLVLCVSDLPDDLPCGGGANYRRNVEFTGYFYKTWAYKNSEKPEANSEETPTSSWTRAPVLIGKITKAYPEETPEPSPPFSASAIITTFAILACAWIVLRRWTARPRKNVSRYSR